MPETTPLIKAALNLRGGAGFDVYVYKKVRNEFKKISKEDALGYSLQAIYIAYIIIDNECDCNEKVPPSYRLYANGTNDKYLRYCSQRCNKQ